MATTNDREPVYAAESEQQALDQLETLLTKDEGAETLRLVGPRGEAITLPPSVRALLQRIVHQLARQRGVTIASYNRDLTTHEAAELLGVPRRYLIQLLDQGAISTVGMDTDRRIRIEDLMRYKAEDDATREQALDKLVRLNEEMGLYDT